MAYIFTKKIFLFRNAIFTAIKNVLRQGNLNPEIEEKLLTLQRYQEKQAKGEPFDSTSFSNVTYPTRGTRTTTSVYDSQDSEDSEEEVSDSSTKTPSRRRAGDDDDEWVLDTPRKYIKKAEREKSERRKEPSNFTTIDTNKQIQPEQEAKIIVKTTDSGAGQIKKNIIFCNRIENQNPIQNSFSISGNESEKSPEKALLASKLKMKAAQKIGAADDHHMKHHKLQVKQ